MSANIGMYRQGDVLVRAVAEIPGSASPVENTDRIVLAYGEVTGHAHAVLVDDAREFSLDDAGGMVRRFLEVFERGATLKHEEHAPIPLPPGLYEIVQQREYTPQEVRRVSD